MKAPKNILSLTIMLAMIQFNVIDIKETQACYSIGCILDGIGSLLEAVDYYPTNIFPNPLYGGRSLQSPGMSLYIKLFIETNQLYQFFHLCKSIDFTIHFIN